jgi:hypothetical protein
MKNYKCSQCGLVNWINQPNCKRCHLINPYALPSQSVTEFGVQTSDEVQNPTSVVAFNRPTGFPTPNQPVPQQHSGYETGSNFNSPPPPNFFGQEYGQAIGFAQRPTPNRIPAQIYAEFETAKKHINNARKAGVTWCILAGLLWIVLFLLMAFFIGSKSPELSVLALIPLVVVLVIIGIIGGLTLGVSRKSRVCAVILAGFTGLSLLGNVLNLISGGPPQIIASVLFALLFTYYFGYGVYGTFTYHKLINLYPGLKN